MKAIETAYDGYRFRSRLEARWAVFFKTLGIPYEYEEEGFVLADGTYYLPDFWLPEQQCFIEIKGQTPTREEEAKSIFLAMEKNHPVYIFYGGIWHPEIDSEEDLLTLKKGSSAFIPLYANMLGQDITSPCYRGRCSHTLQLPGEDEIVRCPYSHSIENVGNEGKLVRALYIAEQMYSLGDTCALRITTNSQLHYHLGGQEGKEVPLPISIQEHYDEFVSFCQRFSSHWRWSVGGITDVILPLNWYTWCQCSFCGKFGITSCGNEHLLPCHSIHRKREKDYVVFPGSDKTQRLITAYTAARSARFEHGERG